MDCPKCTGAELTPQIVENVEIDCCPTCHGVWLDANELETLIEANPKELLAEDRGFEAAQPAADQPLRCPRCKGARLIKLNSRLRPGTILDSCTVCYGTWLDAGELTRLAGADLVGWLKARV